MCSHARLQVGAGMFLEDQKYSEIVRNRCLGRKMIDELDLKIIRELQKNSRQTNAELAGKLNTSEATVRRRVKRLLDEGKIRLGAVLNPQAMGYQTAAVIGFDVEPKKIEEVANKLASLDPFYSVSVISGQHDVMTAGYFGSIDELYDFIKTTLSQIEGVTGIDTSVILSWKKRLY